MQEPPFQCTWNDSGEIAYYESIRANRNNSLRLPRNLCEILPYATEDSFIRRNLKKKGIEDICQMGKITTAVLTLHYSEEKFQNHLIAARSNQQVSKVSQILHLKLVNHFLKEDIIFVLFLALKQKISARRNRCFRFSVQHKTICKERIELLIIQIVETVLHEVRSDIVRSQVVGLRYVPPGERATSQPRSLESSVAPGV